MKKYVETRCVHMPDEAVRTGSPEDMSAGSAWAKDAVQYAYEYGLLLETGNRLRPMEQATRVDAAAAFYNLLCVSGALEDNGGLLLPNR